MTLNHTVNFSTTLNSSLAKNRFWPLHNKIIASARCGAQRKHIFKSFPSFGLTCPVDCLKFHCSSCLFVTQKVCVVVRFSLREAAGNRISESRQGIKWSPLHISSSLLSPSSLPSPPSGSSLPPSLSTSPLPPSSSAAASHISDYPIPQSHQTHHLLFFFSASFHAGLDMQWIVVKIVGKVFQIASTSATIVSIFDIFLLETPLSMVD